MTTDRSAASAIDEFELKQLRYEAALLNRVFNALWRHGVDVALEELAAAPPIVITLPASMHRVGNAGGSAAVRRASRTGPSRHRTRMDIPWQPPANERIDVPTDPSTVSFHIHDRVKRHHGTTERSEWGTITGSGREHPDVWLVRDNDGVTHEDESSDLSHPVSGAARRGANYWSVSLESLETLAAEQAFRES